MKSRKAKKCWNCGLEPMSPWEELGKGWFKCSNCGATWSTVPKCKAPIIVLKPDRVQGVSSSPSGPAVVKKEV